MTQEIEGALKEAAEAIEAADIINYKAIAKAALLVAYRRAASWHEQQATAEEVSCHDAAAQHFRSLVQELEKP